MYNAIIHKCVSYRAEYDSLVRRFARYIFNSLFLSIILLLLIIIFVYMSRVNPTRRDMMALSSFVRIRAKTLKRILLSSFRQYIYICICISILFYLFIYIRRNIII